MRKIVTLLFVPVLLAWTFSSSQVAAAQASQAIAAPRECAGGGVALTFDDGPYPETNAVLDELKLYGLKATFFLVGFNVEMYPEIAQRIVNEGHVVGNHTWNHPDLTRLTEAQIDSQLESTNTIIQQVTGIKPKFARPPYGSTNDVVKKSMAKLGLREVIWSQDSHDWADASVGDIVDQLSLVPPGGTLLMHDFAPNTLTAISGIDWYFNTYWQAAPICAGRLATTTNVQPVLDWPGQFYFVHAVR